MYFCIVGIHNQKKEKGKMTNTTKKLDGKIDFIHGNSGVVDVLIQSSTEEVIRTFNVICLDGCKTGDEIIIERYDDIQLVRKKREPEMILAWVEILSPPLSIAT